MDFLLTLPWHIIIPVSLSITFLAEENDDNDPDRVYNNWVEFETDVTPGRYRFTVNKDLVRDKTGEGIPEIFATIERIEDCK